MYYEDILSASCPVGTGDSFLKGKAATHEADHSPPAHAEVKNVWIYAFTGPYVLMAYSLSR
jgi:hypothetical protein